MPKQDLLCPFCPTTSSHGAGLASHIRSAHPKQHSGWSRARKTGRKAAAAKVNPSGTAGGFGGIVARLEQQRNAIESALVALRELGGVTGTAASTVGRKRVAPEDRITEGAGGWNESL